MSPACRESTLWSGLSPRMMNMLSGTRARPVAAAGPRLTAAALRQAAGMGWPGTAATRLMIRSPYRSARPADAARSPAGPRRWTTATCPL
jgi:hypothetical protein